MKNLKISKELVSEVLGKEISQIQIVGNTLNYVIPNVETQEDDELVYIDLGQNMNIYEFAFKCKEWAFKNGYIIDTGVLPVIKQGKNDRDYFYTIQSSNGEFLETSDSNDIIKSELNATIKACEWILDLLNIKKEI